MVTIILAVILASTLCVKTNSKYQNLPCLNNGENDGFDLETDDSEDEKESEATPDPNCMG